MAPTNDILREYRDWLWQREQTATAWRRAPLNGPISGRTWQGFYSALEGGASWARHVGWGYVANPAGGFQAMWWGFYPVEGGELYLQLQQRTLAVRVVVPDKGRRRALRNGWSQRVLSAAADAGWGLRRPKHFGSGLYMAVAVWPDWWVVGEDGLVDLPGTLARLEALDAWVRRLADQGSSSSGT
ncbi:MAG: hypothetical protein H6739_23315 [Alphaproteobacteria bacterium]|nr:hypothetical protein [Alphaproteobacteria bacterium]